MEPTSKSFRATLPDLAEAQLDKLKRWTEASCAAGLVLREEKSVILIATRERARTKEAFMRSVRSTLGRLGIIVPNARKRRWLVLTSEDSVAAEIMERHRCAGQSIEALPTKSVDIVDETAEETGDENVRLIALPSAKSSASMIRVAKV